MKKQFLLFLVLVMVCGRITAEVIPERSIRPTDDIKGGEKIYEPSKHVEIDDESTSVLIEADVHDVDVYINGFYQGRTPIVIKDLLPGRYRVELRKRGYEPEFFIIKVRRGYDLHYKVHMQKIVGYIRLYDVPSEARVTVSGSDSTTWVTGSRGYRDYTITTDPGSNEVFIKCFGYEKYSRWVDVRPYDTTSIYVDLVPAAFEISDFKCNKESFNPNYKGRLGQCEVSFEVTTDGKAAVTVFNENDEVVWEQAFNKFTTWEQSCIWDGKTSAGATLPDGNYVVQLKSESGEFEYSRVVAIDSSITYPVLTSTRVGLAGIGSVPVAYSENTHYIMISGQAGAVQSGDALSGDVSFGVLFNFAKHFEIGARIADFPGYGRSNVAQAGVGFKVYGATDLGSVNLCYGGLFRFGLSTDGWYVPSGADCGNGLGAGAMVGVDTGMIYAGYTCQYLIGGTFGDAAIDDYVLSNSICLSVKPTGSIKVGVWGSYFLSNTIDVGAEFCFMPMSSAFIINAKADAMVTPGYGIGVNAGIGLSYLF